MKKKKYLPFYNKCMITLKMPENGLCLCFMEDKILNLFAPSFEDIIELADKMLPMTYWGRMSRYAAIDEFTPFRQTVVLLCAAINNEL